MARSYKHLWQIKEGSEDWGLEFDLKGFSPRLGGSGWVDPGRYGLDVESVSIVKHKTDPKKRNFLIRAKTVEPAEFAGVPIVRHQPVPESDNSEDRNYPELCQFMWSMSTASGKTEQAMKAEKIPITGKGLAGRRFYAMLRGGQGEYADRSEIARYISAEEFAAKPGPDASIRRRDHENTNTFVAQTEEPEVFGSEAAPAVQGSDNSSKSAEELIFA